MDNEYCYIQSEENNIDLFDLFDGVYVKEKNAWRFKKSQEKIVLNFLSCSSSEDEQDLNSFLNNSNEKTELKIKKDRLHRANSFNASDNTNDSDSSIEDSFMRKRNIQDSDISKLKKKLKSLK
jgi:hypothetical protein